MSEDIYLNDLRQMYRIIGDRSKAVVKNNKEAMTQNAQDALMEFEKILQCFGYLHVNLILHTSVINPIQMIDLTIDKLKELKERYE